MKTSVLCILAFAATAHADVLDLEHFYFRAGVLHMAMFSKSKELTLADVQGPASLAIANGPVAGSGVAMDPVTTPAMIIGYKLPWWNERVSLETILAAPIQATFRATGTLKDMSLGPTALGLPTGVQPLGSELGEADAAPPVFTAVATLATLGPVRPYAGGGLAVLIAYDAHATNPQLTAVSQPAMKVDPGAGLVLQGGLDMQIYKRITARIDLKYIAFMQANATVTNVRIQTPDLPLFNNVEVGTAKMSMELNPLVVLFGVGIAL